jgi:hypothetical protein
MVMIEDAPEGAFDYLFNFPGGNFPSEYLVNGVTDQDLLFPVQQIIYFS